MIASFSTGLDSFSNPSEIGPMYPFVDADWLFVLIGVLLWLGWHARQIRDESIENEETRAKVDEVGLERAMYYGGSALVPTDEEWAEAGRRGYPGARVEQHTTPPPGATPPPGGAPPPPPPA